MRNRPLFSGSLILFLLIALGIITGGARFVKELRPSALEKEIQGEENIRLSGQVYDLDIKQDYQIIYLKNNSIVYQNKSFEESKIIVYDEEKMNIEIGNQLEVSGEISFFEEERNPGNFNQKLYYQKQGIQASVWAENVKVIDFTRDKLRNSLFEFRTSWEEKLYEMMGEEDGAILSAMLLGEKSGMDEEIKELYQVNGVAHVLAISGLHLSIIGVGLYRIFRRISGSFLAGGAAGISFLLLYILMIGMSVSVLRALVMFLFRVGADMVGRHYDGLTALSVAALITILWSPLCLYDGGFWLSYGAILAVLLVLPIFEDLPFQGFWTSVSINMVTLPVLLCNFYEIPFYSVVLNMIVIPLMTVMILCGIGGSACASLFVSEGIFGSEGIAGVMFWICRIILKIYEHSCNFFVKLPYARIVAGRPSVGQVGTYYICLLLFVMIWRNEKRGQKKRKLVDVNLWKVLTSVLMTFSILMMIIPVHERGVVEVTMLDVGQGDGIFIRGPKGNTYLIDGGSSDVNKVGKYRIEPFLKSRGVGKIDYVFVSHGDSDHISGINEMIERSDIGIAIETIVFPERDVWDEHLFGLARLAEGNEIRIVEMKAGEVFCEDKLELTCLAPDSEERYAGESNAASMVLALNYGKFDMLFTGDVEGEGEEILTAVLADDYQKVSWEVLKVAHHGSKNSSPEAFLNEVRPTYSIISAGRDNSYGHPHKETLERLKSVGSKILSTQENGAVIVMTNGKKMKVTGYLKTRQR